MSASAGAADMLCASSGEPAVAIRVSPMGSDVVFLVTGGTAHIGASATAWLTPDHGVCVAVTTLPGHREGELAEQLARMAAGRLGRSVAVLVGIHLERPSRSDLSAVVEEARDAMARTIDSLVGAEET